MAILCHGVGLEPERDCAESQPQPGSPFNGLDLLAGSSGWPRFGDWSPPQSRSARGVAQAGFGPGRRCWFHTLGRDGGLTTISRGLRCGHSVMMRKAYQYLMLTAATLSLAARVGAADATAATNGVAAVSRDEMARNYLQIQEQLRATQLAIEQNQEAALETSQSNALARRIGWNRLRSRWPGSGPATRRPRARRNRPRYSCRRLRADRLGRDAVDGLFPMARLHATGPDFRPPECRGGQRRGGVPIGRAGRATVEASTAQLLDVVGRLERRINELEAARNCCRISRWTARRTRWPKVRNISTPISPERRWSALICVCLSIPRGPMPWSNGPWRWRNWAATTKR